MTHADIKQIEMDVLLEAINRRYGFDFRNYARASLERRIVHRMRAAGMTHISDLVPRLLNNQEFFECFLRDMSITVTEMFRDPHFFLSVREHVIPVLKTYPFIKVWHAGCATGEEVYSMAILLHEEGFYDRTQFYATDFNTHSLEQAREGIYSGAEIAKYAGNYEKAGGTAALSDYYRAGYDSVKIHDWLKRNIVFSHHNLVADGVFGEMNLIVCRNVLIYFDKSLQDRVLSLLADSLCHYGFLCLGTKESLDFSCVRDHFEPVMKQQRVFQKVRSRVAARPTGVALV